MKHGNYAGSARNGGVLVVAGDDPGAKSSSLPHQSEHALIHCGIPVLYPADVQDCLDFGILGWAMSRYAGCWVGVKCTYDVAESTSSVDVSIDRIKTVVPDDELGQDRSIKWITPFLELEQQAIENRLPAAQRFARANGIDRVARGALQPRLGIVTAGKAYGDVCAALDDLGIDETEMDRLGLAVYKVGMTWPLEPLGLQEFAEHAERLLVVEEKRPLIEEQIASVLYGLDHRPKISGKRHESGTALVPSVGELDSSIVGDAIARWLDRPAVSRRTTIPVALGLAPDDVTLTRRPSFCAGCPHNSSTVVPDGSFAFGGIGCHGMVHRLPERHTLSYTQMGGEGANWIGITPFSDTAHMFQNLGDGTYAHSGSLAVRASVAAGVNITYKILVNGAVAMTGGQPIEGYESLDSFGLVHAIVRQLEAEGVKKIAVVTDAPERHRKSGLPAVATIHHRDDLEAVQLSLRDTPGVTAIVYDQVCAAEARRLRKRGRAVEPDERVVINEAVCEGCGDCGVQSNCIAVEPVETEFGRKRVINQHACNKDFSCLRGYCPSFAVVSNAKLRKPEATDHGLDALVRALPEPRVADSTTTRSVLITGIGGTGVVTLGALLGVAAHIEGKACNVLDITGAAQKNGPVTSHVRVADDADRLHAARIGAGGADVVIGCDAVTTASAENLAKMRRERTIAIVNRDIAPTADFAGTPDLDLSSAPMEAAITRAAGREGVTFVEATAICRKLLGDDVTTNVFLLGFALQAGLLPVSRAALERAIELNGSKVELNVRAVNLGRLAAHDLSAVRAAAAGTAATAPQSVDLQTLIEQRATFLEGYGDKRNIERYRGLVHRVSEREQAVIGAEGELTEAVARAITSNCSPIRMSTRSHDSGPTGSSGRRSTKCSSPATRSSCISRPSEAFRSIPRPEGSRSAHSARGCSPRFG